MRSWKNKISFLSLLKSSQNGVTATSFGTPEIAVVNVVWTWSVWLRGSTSASHAIAPGSSPAAGCEA